MNSTPLNELDAYRPNYTYKTAPKGKQRDVVESTWQEHVWALLCRPGTGKTKMSIDTAGMLYCAKQIAAMIVVSPNGVHRQWVNEGIPTHLADGIKWVGGVYNTDMGIRAFTKLQKSLQSRTPGLRVLSLSFDGLQTKRGKELALALASAHPALLVVDESHKVSNTKATSYKAVLKLASQCRYKRIATGTLLRQNPYAAFGQFELLGHGLLGITAFSAFKSMYAEMLPQNHGLVQHVARSFQEKTGRKIQPQIPAKGEDDRPIFKNLGHLRKMVLNYSSILTLADVNGKEPEVRILTRYVQLSAEQRQMYNELDDLGVTEHAGGVLTADSTLSTATRLCQIAGGFVPNDDDPNALPIAGVNPKLDDLLEFIDELGPDESLVIWAKFTAEIGAICGAISAHHGGASVVRYDGTVTDKNRTLAKEAFASKTARFFVGQMKAGGTGLDGLQGAASYMVFYSNDYSYTDREQAIARLARTGGADLIIVTDIMAEDSADEDVVRCMQTAQDVHEKVFQRRVAYE